MVKQWEIGMNKIYKIVWNSIKRQWTVTSELAKKGKTKSAKILVLTCLTSIPAYSVAICTITNSQISAINENCPINSSQIYDNQHSNDLFTVKDGGHVLFIGDNTFISTGQNHAVVIGTPDSNNTNQSGYLNYIGNLNIYNDATQNADINQSNYRSSGMLIGDNSSVTITGNLYIEHKDNESHIDNDPNKPRVYQEGAAIRVWNKNYNSTKFIHNGKAYIKSNGGGIHNGEEIPSLLEHKGGYLTFSDEVTIESKSVGLINNAGIVQFLKNANITATDGTAIVQTEQLTGSIKVNNNLTLNTEGKHNTLKIHGGNFYVGGEANINAKATHNGGDSVDPNNPYDLNNATSSGIYVTGGYIIFGDKLNITTNANLNFQRNGKDFVSGDVVKISRGTINLAAENNLTATGSGNAINMSGGTVTIDPNKATTVNINTNTGKAILMTGGDLTLSDTNINKITAGTAIDFSGGTFTNKGTLTFLTSSNDQAAIHSNVGSGNDATFVNDGSVNINAITDMTDIIRHEGSGTLNVINNNELSTLKNNGKVLSNIDAGVIKADNNGNLTGIIDAARGEIYLNNLSGKTWFITGNSNLTNLINDGTLWFKHASASDFYNVNITGDYNGNGEIKMHTVWNHPGDADGANSYSDVLNIEGTASGKTTIIPVSANDQMNIIDGDVKQIDEIINTIPVVKVGSHSNDQVFTGTATTTGASEVQLAKREKNGKDEYFWTVEAKDSSDDGVRDEDNGGNGNGNGNGSNDSGGNGVGGGSIESKLIYAEPVAGYVVMPRVNLEQGFASLATLRERRGDMTCDDCSADGKQHSWGRIIGKHNKQNGKERLNLNTDIYGLQIGHDFWTKHTDNNGLNMLGGYLSYSHANTDFSDKYHAKNGLIISDKYTGKGKSDNISLGITNTYYAGNGSYLDLVAQLSYLHNKYTARSGNNPDSQDGWGAAVSAETGRTLPLGKSANWTVTPQAQLIYQYLDLDNFNDGIRHVDQNNQDALRGRIGVMLAYNATGKSGKNTSVYTVGNIWHDFIKPDHVNIGHDSVREKYNQTWGEIGVGVQIPVAKQSQLYGDIRYEHNFGSSKYQSFSGNIGLKINW